MPPPLNPSGFLVALIALQAYTILTPVHSRYAALANLIRGTVTQLVGAWFLPFSVLILIGAVSNVGNTSLRPCESDNTFTPAAFDRGDLHVPLVQRTPRTNKRQGQSPLSSSNTRADGPPQVKYVLATVCVGFPALQEFKAESEYHRV